MSTPTRTAALASFVLLACAISLAAWLLLNRGLEDPAQAIPQRPLTPVAVSPEGGSELAPVPNTLEPERRSEPGLDAGVAEAKSAGPSTVAIEQESAPFAPPLSGRVLDPQGRPVAGALVALIELRRGAPIGSNTHAKSFTDKRGHFELPVPDWAWGQPVLVSARMKGWRPYSSVQSLTPSLVGDPQDLLLEEGFAIKGRVVRDGAPVAGANVQFDVAKGTSGIRGVGSESWWANDRLEEKRGNAQTAEDGSFQLTGLSPAVHHIRIKEKDAPKDRIASSVFEVEAPDSRTYDLSSALVQISLHGRSGLLEGIELKVSAGHGNAKVESDLIPVEVEVPPLSAIYIRAEHPSGQHAEQTIQSPAGGQVIEAVLVMQIVERPRLIVTLPGASAAGIQEVPLRLLGSKGAKPVEVVALPMGQPDTFLVAIVPVDEGQCDVLLDPRSSSGRQRFMTPQRVALDLPKAGDVHVDFPLGFGGRCDVKLTSSIQTSWSARYQLLDKNGKVRSEGHYIRRRSEGKQRSWTTASLNDFLLDSRSYARPKDLAKARGLLPPGRYTLQVTSKEHETSSQVLEVSAGEATKVKVKLEPL